MGLSGKGLNLLFTEYGPLFYKDMIRKWVTNEHLPLSEKDARCKGYGKEALNCMMRYGKSIYVI